MSNTNSYLRVNFKSYYNIMYQLQKEIYRKYVTNVTIFIILEYFYKKWLNLFVRIIIVKLHKRAIRNVNKNHKMLYSIEKKIIVTDVCMKIVHYPLRYNRCRYKDHEVTRRLFSIYIWVNFNFHSKIVIYPNTSD